MRGPAVAIAVVVAVVCGAVAAVLLDGGSEEPKLGETVYQLLTDSDRAEARRVVSDSAELRRLLRGHSFTIESVGVWDGDVLRRAPQLPGFVTIVRVRIAPPIARVQAQWPHIGEFRPCRRTWVPLTVSDLREVSAFVHLEQSAVAAMVPLRSGGVRAWEVRPRPDSSCRVS